MFLKTGDLLCKYVHDVKPDEADLFRLFKKVLNNSYPFNFINLFFRFKAKSCKSTHSQERFFVTILTISKIMPNLG